MGSWIAFTPFHTLLVPEYDTGRVQEVDVQAKRHIRMLGAGELQGPTGVRPPAWAFLEEHLSRNQPFLFHPTVLPLLLFAMLVLPLLLVFPLFQWLLLLLSPLLLVLLRGHL